MHSTAGEQLAPERLTALADAARALSGQDGVEQVVAAGCRLAVELVPDARQAGVVRLLRGGRSTTLAATPEVDGELRADPGEDDWVALPLECPDDALVLYLHAARPLDEFARQVAALLAAQLSIAVRAAQHNTRAANLERALETSRDIGVAMGIIMARRACTRDAAFDLLRRASRARQRKLAAIAADVAAEGILELDFTGDVTTGRLN